MKYILLTVLIIISSCQYPSFEKDGGILFTLQIPNNTPQADIDKAIDIYLQRILAITRNEPLVEYVNSKQAIQVGIATKDAIDDLNLWRSVLTATGTFKILENYSYEAVKEAFEKINADYTDGTFDLDTIPTFFIDDKAPFYGNAALLTVFSQDTNRIKKVMAYGESKGYFPNNFRWSWGQEEEAEPKYLYAYKLPQSGRFINETMVKNAKVKQNDYGMLALNMELNDEGAAIFEKMTTDAFPTAQPLHIFIDDKLVSSPVVQSPITGGKLQVTGEEENMATWGTIMEYGSLPFRPVIVSEAIVEGK